MTEPRQGRGRVYRSMDEIERQYLPSSRLQKDPRHFSDSEGLGAGLAKDSPKRASCASEPERRDSK